MRKIMTAIGLGSALMLAPALAIADESTTPPTPNTEKTPGNGPTTTPMGSMHSRHHRHHHHHMMKPMAAPADAPKS